MASKPKPFSVSMDRRSRDRSGSLRSFALDGVVVLRKKALGVGSYGVVFELEFRGLKCAGKRLHNSLITRNQPSKEREAILQRFETECNILSDLRHPNIVQFLGIYYESTRPDIPIMVMEFLPMNLTSCIEDYGILPAEVAYSILRDVALGLSYLHGFRPDPIVHRDLSANNILLTADMTAKISDLGVARILNLTPTQQQRLTQAPGTLLYMPPEALALNPEYTTALDIFSCGILILHIFIGKWPIPSEATIPDPADPDKLIAKNEVERREESFREMGPDHPLTVLTKQCLHNLPGNRPAVLEVLSKVKTVLALVSSKLTDKVQTILWERRLKSDIQKLQTSIATFQRSQSLTAEGPEGLADLDRVRARAQIVSEGISLVPEPGFGRRHATSMESGIAYTSSRQTSMQTFMSSSDTSSMMTRTGSYTSVYSHTPESGAQISPHPYQPGAELVLTKDGCCDLPVGMYDAQAIVIESKVYVGGGSTKGRMADNTIFVYGDPDENWSRLPPCPVTLFGLAFINNQISTIGGRIVETRGITNLVHTYDDDSDPKWQSIVPPMLTARHSLTVAEHGGNIIACGGRDGDGISNAVEVFTAVKQQWFTTYSLPFPFYKMSSTVIHGTCYFLGGYDQFAFTNKVVYASVASLLEGTVTKSEKSAWQNLAVIRYNYASAANCGGCLLAVGGSRMIGRSRIDIYSQLTKSWVKLTDLAGRDAYVSPIIAELSNSKFLIIGGATSNFEPHTGVYLAKIKYHQ